ncbi:hypothetical protein PRUPE_2G034200 [Prunus persica]|uniref:Probable magnesium transporter n=1 Tax=Prunus persica TaxID=3760 RepID=M5XNF2_PRUPE|nr:hypothetical protein PRUPE_2G034200 [Prunus persica]
MKTKQRLLLFLSISASPLCLPIYHKSLGNTPNYKNPKSALDTFNTAIVSPIYYAMFTSFTIFASAIMFKDYSGFITVSSGTAILHSTRGPDPP